MFERARVAAAALTTASCLLGFRAVAAASGCSEVITRDSVVRCVVGASLALSDARWQTEALEGRREAVSPLLPSNPKLSVSAAHRSSAEQQGGNWFATLSQELEIAGQRSARRSRADAELRAQQSELDATKRAVAELAWRCYFQALAARDALVAARKLEQIFAHSSAAAEAAAARGLLSGVDAEVAQLSALKLTEQRIEAERGAEQALAALASLLGRDPARPPKLADDALAPLGNVAGLLLPELKRRVEDRVEITLARQQRSERRLAQTALERARVPNVTVSLLAQHAGFGEQVLGGGIALPLPLPYPVGRTLHGELAESRARVAQADVELERVKRELYLELVQAFHAHAAAQSRAALYPAERVAQAERNLEHLAGALREGRVPVAQAVVAQQRLVEFLIARIEARLELCFASVALARSAGLPLWGSGL